MRIWQTSSGRTCSPADRTTTPLLPFALMAAFVLSVLLGSSGSPAAGIAALLRWDTASPDFRILIHLRLPRALAAVLAGSALAVSGVLIQAVLNNPMAAPNIIGVNSGAGLAAAISIAVIPEMPLPLAAFLGALAASLLIYAIASRTGAGKLTITLVGIAVGNVLNGAINTVKVLFPDSIYDADLFLIGGFSGVTYGRLLPAGGVILAGLVLARALARDIDILSLGSVTAASLGQNIALLRFVLLVIASALAGAAVSFAGLLGFVGLLVPHIIRRRTGNRHERLIPRSALLGSLLVLVCDLFARTAFAPHEIPVGIVLSIVGGTFFLFLVLSGKRRAEP